jgi:putative ABC transport system permease protein
VAALAVALGVALAWSVHLINSAALAEFAAAVRSANGEPDLVLRAQRGGFDDALFERVAADAAVSLASPVLEIDTYARGADGARVALRVLGIDALAVAPLAPDLMPRPGDGEDRLAILDPRLAFVNSAARERLAGGGTIELQSGTRWLRLRVAGRIAATGSPLVAMDIAGAQAAFGFAGRITRIDLRLVPGSDRAALLARLALPDGVQAQAADDGAQRVSNVSRAYRVNLMVLALVALFVGAFLVFSVVALSVAQRAQGFALLGVLGLTARERRALVLAVCAALGLAGSLVGLLLGAALAVLALRWMAGDLGGGYFPGIAPRLVFGAHEAAAFLALGTASALAGGWWPARAAERIAPAQALKGLGSGGGPADAVPWWPGLLLVTLGAALAFAPPVAGLPIAAYAAVAALLFGGVSLVPAVVHALIGAFAPPRRALPLLAWRRAHHQRATATAAVAGVVASLALCTAITVMVASFRQGVADWLDGVLPADLYARSASSSAAAEAAWLPPEFADRAAGVAGVARVAASRVRSLQLAPEQPAVALVARAGIESAERVPLPLLQAPRPVHARLPSVFVSEAVLALYGAAPGRTWRLPLVGEVFVRGVYRDYARQFGSVAIELERYRALTGDTRLSDLALWLAPGADAGAVMAALRAQLPDPALLDFASAAELRAISLAIFDRSFAVTYFLQAVAIAIGLVGIAASLSAQVLARRKEFGLLAHLGLTRRQIVAVVGGESAAWLATGVLLGLALGLAVSLVLVFVVNPQSFHWSMDLVVPALRLAALAAAVFALGLFTALLVARGAASRAAVLSVKEDW